MRSQVTLKPGQKGTRKLLDQYGSQLVCVRYRDDEQHHRRLKTVELIVEEAPWKPQPIVRTDPPLVGVRVGFKEVELQRRVKMAGGKWNPERRVWEMRYDRALALGLEARIEKQKASNSRYRKASNTRC